MRFILLPVFIHLFLGCTKNKNIEKSYDIALRESRQSYYRHKYENSANKSKTIWSIVNKKTCRGQTKPQFNNMNTPQQLVEDFGLLFRNPLNQHQHTDIPDALKTVARLDHSFFMFEVTDDELLKVVKNLANKTSVGYDGIPTRVIKGTISLISHPLRHILNNSFQYGVFPDMLKIAVIKPIHKKNDPNDINNYRPISLLSNFSTIFEKIMVNRLLSFFRKLKVLNEQQHGFIKGKNTETANYKLVEMITEGLEMDEQMLGFFLDFSKAFDSVNHKILQVKLEAYGIRDAQLKFFESYLSERSQHVSIIIYCAEYTSVESIIEQGVIQGSVLGPLLFVVYINDIPNIVKHVLSAFIERNYSLISQLLIAFVNFADDSNNLICGKNRQDIQDLLEYTYQSVQEWCTLNNLHLNVDKTEFVLFAHKLRTVDTNQQLKLSGENICPQATTKFLGIRNDNHLEWTEHIDELCKTVFVLRVLRSELSLEFLKAVYFSNFQSVMSYGVVFWGNGRHFGVVISPSEDGG